MHMADALISPAVGGTMLAAAAGTAAYAIKKTQNTLDEKKIPLMGIMAAFVFAAQMINFSIPGTGSSGHLGGGLLLAIILGPYAGFLAMSSVLIIQALFFADGGLLALGCNIMNLGFFTCFITYPLIFKPLTCHNLSVKKLTSASIIAAVLGLQLGAFSVVLETLISGKTELPFLTFVTLMQPIHLAIGIVEGIVTAAVVSYVFNARPEIIKTAFNSSLIPANHTIKRVTAVLAISAVITGGMFSWFASSNPDGLEWAMGKTAGTSELEAPEGIHDTAASLQNKIALMPDYNFLRAAEHDSQENDETWPAVNAGTSAAGILGGISVLILAVVIGITGILFRKIKSKTV